MKYRWRRHSSAALSYFILFTMMLNMVAPALWVSAQDLHQEAPEGPAPTAPGEPIVIPTSDDPTPLLPSFYDDFQQGPAADWHLSEGWSLGLSAQGNLYLTTTAPGQLAAITGQVWDHVSISADLGIAPGSTAALSARVTDTSSYSAVFDAYGAAYLYRGAQLLASMTDTAIAPGQFADGVVWHQVNLSAIGNHFSVTVNGLPAITYTDDLFPQAIPGQVVFSTGVENTGSVTLDKVYVQGLPAPSAPPEPETGIVIEADDDQQEAPVESAPPLTDTEIVTEIVVIPEATTETAEPVLEELQEEPQDDEAPLEPELESITAPVEGPAEGSTDEEANEPEEASVEGIAPTPVPYNVTEALQAKFGAALLRALEAAANGDEASAEAIAQDHFMERDAEGRYRVILWVQTGHSPESLAALVNTHEGILTRAEADHIEAYLAPLDLLNLAASEAVLAVTLPERAVSTSAALRSLLTPPNQRTGDIAPHSLDILGVPAWHQAGATGAGVNIAVIDTGFQTPEGSSAAERTCLGSNAVENGVGNTSHGIEVVEVLCDMAPGATVWMYKAANAIELQEMINRAARVSGFTSLNGFPRATLILVTMDTGITGTNFAGAVNAAVASNIPVIASAGNTGTNAALRFDFVGGQSQITVHTSAGSVISYGWEGEGHYPTQLHAGDTPLDSRLMRTNSNAHQYVVPASCGDACSLTLTIQGDAPAAFRVQVAGGRNTSSLMPDATIMPLASGSLTELASLDSVISVGAVCSWQAGSSTINRYQILPESSIGDPAQPKTANIKPSVVAPSRVATSISPAQPECEGGFGGTSAAAAHVAGMAALLISNPNMDGVFNVSFGRPFAIKTYLQTRTIDLHVGATPDGFDHVYGAGLVQLGNPFFIFSSLFINTPADAVAGSAYYVNSARLPFTEPDGSITRPFTHPAQAIQKAIDDGVGSVVLLPGEYVTSFAIPNPNRPEPLTITSFDAVDTRPWFPSEIWANDMYRGIAGITIEDSSNVVISELYFRGSSPLYTDLLPAGQTSPSLRISELTPFEIIDSTNITILNNRFENFDAPSVINRGQNINIRGNRFTGFRIPTTINIIDGQPREVPLFQSSVLRIADSGQTNQINIEQNTFEDNILPLTLGTTTSTIQEPVINVERSQVYITRNRFINNVSESVISVNQWGVGQETAGEKPPGSFVDLPVVIFSNLFDNNPIGSSLVQIYQSPRFYFVNNTVVNHNLTNQQFGNIIALGHGETDRLSLVDHRWELHNNLFYNVRLGSKLIGHPTISLGSDGCLPIGSNLGDPQIAARNNWFAPNFDGGECGISIGSAATPLNNNIYTLTWPDANNNETPLVPNTPDQAAASAAARANFEQYHFFTATLDPFHPYRLRPTDDELAIPQPSPVRYNPGIDTGDNSAVTSIPNLGNPPLDLLGLPRIINRPPDPAITVDIGAYELGDPEPLAFVDPGGDYDLTVPEDTIIILNLGTRIEGGFEPYRFEFTNLPTVFDTNPFSPCGGQPYSFNPETYVFTYCPPPDFHNEDLIATNPAAEINFSYRVFGLLDTLATGLGPARINIVYTSVPEDEPMNPTAPTKVFLLEQNETLNFRLEPNAFFNNQGNIEFSHPDPSIFEDSPDVDYPFTYSALSVDTAAPRFNPRLFSPAFPEDPSALSADQIAQINTILNNALDSDNIFKVRTPGGFNPVFGQTGAFEFTYSVTDSDGDTGTRRVRVRFVERIGGTNPGGPGPGGDGDEDDSGDEAELPPDGSGPGEDPGGPGGGGLDSSIRHIGLHDDASLDWRYSAGWVPFYYAAAINETLHYSTAANQTAEFVFNGDGFNLHWLGYQGGGTYRIDLDHDDDGNFTPYNQLGLRCTNNSSAATLSTNTTAPLEFITFGCAGLSELAPDVLRRIRITTQSSAPIVLDAMEVRDVNLLAGFYDVKDFAFQYSGSWQNAVFAGPVNDTLQYTQSSGTVNFRVDGQTVDAIVVYYTAFPGAGTIEVSLNGALANTINTDGPALAFGQAAVITNVGDLPANVELRAAGTFVGIEGIELVSGRRALTPGFYYLADNRIRAAGGWASFNDPTSRTGVLYYNTSPNAGGLIFTLDASTVDRVVVNHTNDTWAGTLQVCGTTCATTVSLPQSPTRYSIFNVSDLFPNLLATQTTVSVSLNVVEGFVGIESLRMVDSSQGLAPGYYDQIRDAFNIRYTDGSSDDDENNAWLHAYYAGPRGGSASWARGEAFAEFDLQAGASGLVIYHSQGSFSGFTIGDMQVCAAQCATVPGGSGALVGNIRTVLTADQLGLTGAATTVTIRPTTGWIALEGIQVVGGYANTELPMLPTTFNKPTARELLYVDEWAVYQGIEPISDFLFYSFRPGAAIVFKFEGEALDIYRTSGFGSGAFEVCIDVTNCNTFQGSNAATITWSERLTVDAGGPGGHVVEIRSLDAGWLGIEGVEVANSKRPLTFGYHQENDPNLNYIGSWQPEFDADAGGAALRTASGTATSLTFTVSTGQAARVVVHHPNSAVWGQMQVCVNGTCETARQGSATNRFAVFDLPSANADVVITPANGRIAIEGIEIIPAVGPLKPGYYANDSYDLKPTNWIRFSDPSLKDGSVLYSTSAASISFNLNANEASALGVHHPFGAVWGNSQIRVCGVPATNCQNINIGTATSSVTRIETSALGLAGASAPVSIEWAGGFGGFHGVEILGGTLGMGPGYYEDDSINLALTNTEWTRFTSAQINFAFDISGGSAVYSNVPNASISYRIGGGVIGTDAPVTGFVNFFTRFAGASPVEICYTRQSTGLQICMDDTTDNALPGVVDGKYGISVVGLPPHTEDNSALETYNVTIRNAGTTANQYLIFDAVTVLGQPTGKLRLGTGRTPQTYDDSDANIVFAPGPMWSRGYFGAPYYDGTLSFANHAGALAQVSMRGNALTMFQLPFNLGTVRGSSEVRFCQVIGTATDSAADCNDYSLNNLVSFFPTNPSKITLYGFGFGDHEIIIENRDNFGFLIIDAIQVR